MVPNEGAGGIVLGSDGKIVVVHQHGNSWSFPKGGVEEGESLLEGAIREIKEETGIDDLELISELGSYERKSIGKDGTGETEAWGSRKRTFFLFKTNAAHLRPEDTEVTEALFVSIDEALALLTHPKDREFLESVRDIIEAHVSR